MNRFASWVLVMYALGITGFAAYQYAYVQHLNFIIRMLVGGSPN